MLLLLLLPCCSCCCRAACPLAPSPPPPCSVAAPVLSRLAGYPSKACSQLQRVTAWLPRRVGRLLQEDPQLVAAAVDAFVSRWAGVCGPVAAWA